MTNNAKTHTPQWLKGLVKPFRTHAALALALGVASACCSALLMFVSGYLICRTALPETTLFMVMAPVALVQIFGIGRPLAHYFERLVSHDWVFRVTSYLRKRLFLAAQAIADDPANPKSSGDYLEMLADDIGHLQNLYLRVTFPVVIALILLVCATVFSCMFDILLGLAVLAIGVIAALAMPAFAYACTKALQLQTKQLKATSYSQMTDDVMGSLDWSLAGRSGDAVNRNKLSGHALATSEAKVRTRIRIVELASALVMGLGAVLVTCLAASAFQGYTPTSHYIAAFALGLFPLMQVFTPLPGAVSDAPTHRLSINHLDGVLSHGGEESPISPTEMHPAVMERSDGIRFDSVSYRYPASKAPAIEDMSLSIPRGQKVALIGQSGSGKSTFAALVRGAIAPDKGSIVVGGTTRPESPKLVSYIPQTPYIFDSTLRENLAFADPQAPDETMLEALASVGLQDKVASLENGLDTHVGETGFGFSGGEAHRISLARALLSRRPIVVLDEPFSAVDPETERMLLDTLFNAFDGKTLVVITHHLMDIERFDRVILMHDGAITLDGSPNDLAESSSHFRDLISFDRALTAFAR